MKGDMIRDIIDMVVTEGLVTEVVMGQVMGRVMVMEVDMGQGIMEG